MKIVTLIIATILLFLFTKTVEAVHVPPNPMCLITATVQSVERHSGTTVSPYGNGESVKYVYFSAVIKINFVRQSPFERESYDSTCNDWTERTVEVFVSNNYKNKSNLNAGDKILATIRFEGDERWMGVVMWNIVVFGKYLPYIQIFVGLIFILVILLNIKKHRNGIYTMHRKSI